MTHPCTLGLALFLTLAGCGSGDDSLAADGCETIKDELTCRQRGCTPTCGVVFLGYSPEGYDCQARYRASLCLAVLPWSRHDHTNNADQSPIHPGEEVWTCKADDTSRACFRFRNERDVLVGLVSYRNPSTLDWEHSDPCLRYDPDGTRFPWEGACGFHWLTRGLWESIQDRQRVE